MEEFRNKIIPSSRMDRANVKEFISKTREVEKRLHNEPGFIGVGPMGSRWKGYSTTESDYDMVILFDSRVPGSDENGIRAKISDIASFSKDDTRPGDIEANCWRDMAILQTPNFEDHTFCDSAAALLRNLVGPRVAEYREQVALIIRSHPKKEWPDLLDKIATAATHEEFFAFRKAHEKRDASERNLPFWGTDGRYTGHADHSKTRKPLFLRRAMQVFGFQTNNEEVV